jgi:hypothetical protein
MRRTAGQGCAQIGWCAARWARHNHSWGRHRLLLLLEVAGWAQAGLQQQAGN